MCLNTHGIFRFGLWTVSLGPFLIASASVTRCVCVHKTSVNQMASQRVMLSAEISYTSAGHQKHRGSSQCGFTCRQKKQQ